MRITCTTTFLDGVDRYEAGDVRTVPDDRGAYFVANGWAAPAGEEPREPFTGAVTLDVQNSTTATGDSNG